MEKSKVIEVLTKLASYEDIVSYMEEHSVTVQDALLEAVSIIEEKAV